MMRSCALGIGLIAVLAMAGCTTAGTDVVVETVIVTETADPTAEPVAGAAELESERGSESVADAYQRILDNPPVIPESREARFHPTGTWSYALVEATGDDVPDMLLKVNGSEFSRVLLYTLRDGEAIGSSDVLIDGAAGAGGSRARIVASKSGDGVHQIDWQSISPNGTSTRYRLEGTNLVKAGDPTTFQIDTYLPDHHEITWLDSTDRSGLAPGAVPVATAPAASQPVAAGTADSDRMTFRGVVTEQSTSEVMKGQPSPNGEPESNRYYILVLDTPMEVLDRNRPEPWMTKTVTEVYLGERSAGQDPSGRLIKMLGSRATISATPENVVFPNDTAVPLGMLRIVRDLDITPE